jgi:gentisate 1,2-dioxygenase
MAEQQDEYTPRYGKWETPYQRWQKAEGIPVHTGTFLPDLRAAELAPWPRIGQRAAFVNLADQQEDDGWVIELVPGSKTEVLRHCFEASYYVVEGRGATMFWQEGRDSQTTEWQRGSLFSPPINCNYQLFNGDGAQPARLFAVTNAPMVLNIYNSPEFVFANPFVFRDRYDGSSDFFTGQGKMVSRNMWKTNFIPDVRTMELVPSRRGEGAVGRLWMLSNNLSEGHCTAFPAGTYKRAHRHGVGAHVIIVDGKAYSLLWWVGGEAERQRVDWKAGSVISPKEAQFHQHFNTSPNPARYIALRLGGLDRRKMSKQAWNSEAEMTGIPYEEEDPGIYEMYLRECQANGAEVWLPRPRYTRSR